jgi:hypothetical protein
MGDFYQQLVCCNGMACGVTVGHGTCGSEGPRPMSGCDLMVDGERTLISTTFFFFTLLRVH